jgi:hypothetical protein
MGRFDCVMPRDWNIKFDDSPCSKIVKFDPNENLSPKYRKENPDFINRITILGGKNFKIDRKTFNGKTFTGSYSSGTMSLSSDEEPNAVNFAKKVIISPFYMIGHK